MVLAPRLLPPGHLPGAGSNTRRRGFLRKDRANALILLRGDLTPGQTLLEDGLEILPVCLLRLSAGTLTPEQTASAASHR